MPTYEYECDSCANRFDAFQSMKDEPLSKCPRCGGGVRRVVSGGAGIIYKGSGFYSTDKTAASAAKDKKDAKETPACPAKDSKSACSSCPAAQGAAS